MAEAQASQHLLSKDYQRLQTIEKHVSRCVEVAAEVIELLAQEGPGDADKARSLCAEFLDNVKAAQEKVQEAVGESPTSRNFEQAAEVYEAVYRADTTVHKIKTIQKYLVEMQAALDASSTPSTQIAPASTPPVAAGNGQAETPMEVSTEGQAGADDANQRAAAGATGADVPGAGDGATAMGTSLPGSQGGGDGAG